MSHPFLEGAEQLVREQEELRSELKKLHELLTERLDRFEKNVFTAVNDRLREASTERAKLLEDYFVERVEGPITREIVGQVDFVEQAAKENSELPWVAQTFLTLRDNLSSLLRNFGVERMPETGPLEFDPKRMNAIKRERTSQPARDRQVQVVGAGYTRGDRVLQRQNVVVFECPSNGTNSERS